MKVNEIMSGKVYNVVVYNKTGLPGERKFKKWEHETTAVSEKKAASNAIHRYYEAWSEATNITTSKLRMSVKAVPNSDKLFYTEVKEKSSAEDYRRAKDGE